MMGALFAACLLTVVLETCLFALFGYRDGRAVMIVICANVLTNLLLNLVLILLPEMRPILIPAGEAAVVLAEYAIYTAAFGGSARLFALTAAANILSFSAGYLW